MMLYIVRKFLLSPEHKNINAYRPAKVFSALLFVGIFFSTLLLHAQQGVSTGPYWRVFFSDKGPDSEKFSAGSALYRQTTAIHSERALQRRTRHHSGSAILMLQDAPLYKPYLDSIRFTGASVLLQLRWNNYTVVSCNAATADKIRQMPFVRAVSQTSSRLFPTNRNMLPAPQAKNFTQLFYPEQAATGGQGLQYGESLGQIASINIPELHALGITGKGVRIGFADTGFRWKMHKSTKHARVIAEYDFVYSDTTTADEVQDTKGQDEHGTHVFSTVAGYDPDEPFIGAAPLAEFVLAKTENVRYERSIEQDNFAAAVEWMEAQGVDIISTSLGYDKFDTIGIREESYRYEELDGKTTIVARAVNLATARGVLCVNSAGNNGPALRTLASPGDADSSLTIAASRSDTISLPAKFTSRGPRGDGRLKPDLAARGEAVMGASVAAERAYALANGTSLSTPIVSGGAALLLSVFPELRVWELRSLLIKTASQAQQPDVHLGYGLADIPAAMRSRGLILAPTLASYPVYQAIRVVAAAITNHPTVSVKLYVRFSASSDFTIFYMKRSLLNEAFFECDLPLSSFAGKPAQSYIIADNGVEQRRYPYQFAQTPPDYHILSPVISNIPLGFSTAHLSFVFPEPGIIEGIHPLPVQRGNTATLMMITPDAGILTVSVFSMLGQQVYSGTTAVSTGLSHIFFPTTLLSNGVYSVRVLYNGTVRTFPCIISE